MLSIREQIVQEARTWLGTPYHHCADVKGAGVDCAMILVRVYAACGLLPASFDPRPYSPQWHLHRGEELYQAWIAAAGAIETGSPRAGDVGLWKFGRAYSHAAILVDSGAGEIIHALKDAGRVTLGAVYEQPLAGRACKWYRVVKD
jgi:cell wall-associated NlpC family hydrolase